MNEKGIITFLKMNIEPIVDDIYGYIYRASVVLRDNVTIPCVKFSCADTYIDLAIRRFEEEKENKIFLNNEENPYRQIVSNFCIEHNTIDSKKIVRIERSRYAFPIEILKQIQGETLMSWTGFVVKMRDGNYFNFGTAFSFSFFDLPENYNFSDIVEVINHSYIDSSGKIQNYRKTGLKNLSGAKIYREKDYFSCYLKGL
jgi:hypothetical protein